MENKVLLLHGDGVGPSVIGAAERMLTTVAEDVEIVHGKVGFDAYEETGEYLPSETLDLMRECGYVICGPLNHYKDNAGRPLDLLETMRVSLDLFATVRTFRTLADGYGFPGTKATLWSSNSVKGHDIMEIRDLDGITISKYIRASSYSRMMTRALSDLEISGGKSAICLTRPDMFPDSSEMFDEAFDVAFDNQIYRTEHMNITRWVSNMVRNNCDHDFIVCADMYSHVAAGLLVGMTGGNHLSPVGYVGDSTVVLVPGLNETYTGIPKDGANPTSAFISVAMCLFNMDHPQEAESIINALSESYAAGDVTSEFGGTLNTDEFTNRVISRLQ